MTSRQPILHKQCFYCGALITRNGKGDHFPVPSRAGGTATVPCCESCHDMKDRFNINDWPQDWIDKVTADFPLLSRETKLFLAKVIATVHSEMAPPAKQEES